MADGKNGGTGDFRLTDPSAFIKNLTLAMETAAGIASRMAEHQAANPESAENAVKPVEQLMKTFGAVAQDYIQHPDKLMEANMKLFQAHASLWQSAWARFLGEDVKPVVTPERGDRRFSDPDWSQNQLFDFFKQSYLLTAKWAQETVSDAGDLDEHTRHKAHFYLEQIANAMSPSNFALTNPDILKTTMSTNGANLVEGMRHLAEDFERGGGKLKIKQTDLTAFKLGENLALSPGKVVFQNDVMQLIQYAPAGDKVHAVPLVIVPPWINKFYILDLNPKKSFIRWVVEQGFTVFVLSWINPDEHHAMKSFSDYMRDGILEAVRVACEITGQKQVNTIGYCIGGTLLAATLGYMAARSDSRIGSVTFFTTQVDFTHAGDLKVFVDEEQIAEVEQQMARSGYLAGKEMANAFNLLRSNDLIWSYVINNYLKGKDPLPFDLLYWNADPTRMPAATHSFYLRECYLNNHLSQGKMVLDQVRIDLKRVEVPIYNLAAREDHIAPLKSVFRLASCFGGETTLVVAGSGHIAGVVNPPEAGKYQYWTNDKGAATLEEWLAGATETPGSWWPHWAEWLSRRSGKMVEAREPGSAGYPAIEDAPGSYVKVRDD